MGTRADFYVGRGANAEWIGSIAWDGNPDSIEPDVLHAKTEVEFRTAVETLIHDEDGTPADMGWPWPWDDSTTTDYAYALDGGKVHASNYGGAWFDPQRYDADVDDEVTQSGRKVAFPNMAAQRNLAAPGSKRSGVMVMSFSKKAVA